MIEKIKIRKVLEDLESDIHISWLRDQDKVKEFNSLYVILDDILSKDSIETYFENNASDVNYFLNKFSNEIILNILRQPYVYGVNGDDVALNILCQYLRIFLKFMNNPNYSPLWNSIMEMFDYSKTFFKGLSYGSIRILNEKKLMTAEKFNETILPRDVDMEKIPVNLDDIIDVKIDNKRPYHSLQDLKIWTRGKVTKINLESQTFAVSVAEEYLPIYLSFNSTMYQPVGSMTKDYDWRTNIKECKKFSLQF